MLFFFRTSSYNVAHSESYKLRGTFDGDADSGGVRAVVVGRVAAVHTAVVGRRAQHGQPRVCRYVNLLVIRLGY